jgi:predicted GIY-YIG superfamily endonuclease
MSIPMGDPRRDPSNRNHYVYRYFNADDRLLYVGCTMRPELRWKEHKAFRRGMALMVAKVRMQGPYNFDTAREIERVALATEEPLYGMTPEKRAQRAKKSGFVDRTVDGLTSAGVPFEDAVKAAVAEAEYVFGVEVA